MIRTLLKPTNGKRILFFIFIDVLASYISLYTAYNLRFNFEVPFDFNEQIFTIFAIITSLKIASFWFFRIYQSVWRFFGLNEAKKIVFGHIIAYSLFLVIFLLFAGYFNPFPRSIIVIDLFLSTILIGFIRISKRIYLENSIESSNNKALIFGANSNAQNLIKASLSGDINYYPVAIIDSGEVVGNYISNIRVYDESALEKLVALHTPNSALITAKYEKKALDALFEKLQKLGIKHIKLADYFSDGNEIKEITIEDLLAREPKDLDPITVENFIKDKTILVTGAGGSIGSEICRQCERFGARGLVLVDNSEYNLYAINEELQLPRIAKLISVTQKEELENLFLHNSVDIVIHAAAYKHVPLCEENIKSAITNNIFGSINVIDLSIKHNVKKVVIISTDKAVRPTNVMGATKRVVELYSQNVVTEKTEIVAVRFGNVLGSSGSVIPKFKEQIKKGEDLTVTHPEIRRYFMLIPEACELVLQAAAIAKGGEIFILDMGEPVLIADLAKKLIKLSNKEDSIGIKYTGLRPGEKLYEELLLDESEAKTRYESICVAKPTHYDIVQLKQDIINLLQSFSLEDLQKIVPEFKHAPNR